MKFEKTGGWMLVLWRYKCLLGMVTAVLASGSLSQATTLAMPTVATGYATWDTFADAQPGTGLLINPTAPGASENSLFDLTLSASMPTGGSVTGGGDRVYNGAGPSSVAYNFTLSGTANADMENFGLYVKFSMPDGGYTRTNFLSLTLNGVAASEVFLLTSDTGDVPLSGQTYGLVHFAWYGADIEDGDSISISMSSPSAGHVSIDTVSAVPEPSTYALMFFGLGALVLFRHRQLVTQKVDR